MKNQYLLFLLFCMCLASARSFAQDIHFAHIHASPTYLNPAMTGMFENGSTRFIANARSQWQTLPKGYKTVAISADSQIGSLGGGNLIGGGLQITTDRAGDLNFSKNSASLTFSALKSLDRRRENFIAVGLRNTFNNYRLDYSKMVGFDSEPLVENGVPNNLSFWDVSIGAAWYYTHKDKKSFYLGAGVFHVNTPNVSFFDKLGTNNDLEPYEGKDLYMKFVLHGGGFWKISRQFIVMPSFIYSEQGPHQEISGGSFFRVARGRSFVSSNYAFYFGSWVRWYVESDVNGIDAIISSIRMDINRTSYTFSFDANVSRLRRASFGFGGPEISIVKIIGKEAKLRKPGKISCPSF